MNYFIYVIYFGVRCNTNFVSFHVDMIDLEGKLDPLESEVMKINTNKETLKKNLQYLIELQHILYKTHGFFQEVRPSLLLLSDFNLTFFFCQPVVVCVA